MRDPEHMRIYSQCGDIKGFSSDNLGCFLTHARKFFQLLDASWYTPAKVVYDHPRQTCKVTRFAVWIRYGLDEEKDFFW